VVEASLRSFLATLPGVVGSSVTVTTGATVQQPAAASTVVQAVIGKATRVQAQSAAAAAKAQSEGGEGQVAAQSFDIKSYLTLPPQINVSCVCV
jgi:hypothetical protein